MKKLKILAIRDNNIGNMGLKWLSKANLTELEDLNLNLCLLES